MSDSAYENKSQLPLETSKVETDKQTYMPHFIPCNLKRET